MKVKRGEKCFCCNRYYSRYLACDGLVYKNSRVLLVKRKTGNREGGNWALPGGFISWNETAPQAALREVWEETGVKGKIIKLLGVYSDPQRDGMQNVAAVFLIRPLKEKDRIDKQEVEEKQWFDKDSLPQNIAFDHKQILKEFFEKED